MPIRVLVSHVKPLLVEILRQELDAHGEFDVVVSKDPPDRCFERLGVNGSARRIEAVITNGTDEVSLQRHRDFLHRHPGVKLFIVRDHGRALLMWELRESRLEDMSDRQIVAAIRERTTPERAHLVP